MIIFFNLLFINIKKGMTVLEMMGVRTQERIIIRSDKN